MKNKLALFLFITISLIWGSSFYLIKKGLIAYEAGQVGALRIVFAFLFMLPWALSALKTVPKNKLKFLLLVGLIGNLIPAFLFAKAEQGLASSLTGALNGLTPLFTFLIGLFIFKNRIHFGQSIGISFGFIGTLSLSFVGEDGQLGSMNLYAFLVLLATMMNIIKMKLAGIKPMHITAIAMFMIGPIATIYLFSTDFVSRLGTHDFAWPALAHIAILGVVGTAIALALFNKLIHLTSAVYASSVTYLIPVIAVLWGLYDGETLFPKHYLGMAIILVGIYLVNKFRKA